MIRFLPTTITIGSGIGETEISLQLFPFVALLTFSYINRRRAKQIISGIIKNKPLTEAEIAEQRELRIEAFKKKFGGKPVKELATISNSTDTLDKNAVEAAKRLISERSHGNPRAGCYKTKQSFVIKQNNQYFYVFKFKPL